MANWTRTNYKEYIASEEWRSRRRDFLGTTDDHPCNRCGIPRWLHRYIYDQDIHVHHKSYARIGQERNSDLEALCARCHEIESFGKTSMRDIKPLGLCEACKERVWFGGSGYDDLVLCRMCDTRINGPSPLLIISDMVFPEGFVWWQYAIVCIVAQIGFDEFMSLSKKLNDSRKDTEKRLSEEGL